MFVHCSRIAAIGAGRCLRWGGMWVAMGLLAVLVGGVQATELTFELEDNDEMCFHEEVKPNVKCTLEYQVITGGKYDVDVTLQDPGGNVLYRDIKKQYHLYEFTSKYEGTYAFCFSNQFSSFTHKTVYFDFQAGDDESMKQLTGERQSAFTQLEQSSVNVHESLTVIADYQTHNRLREYTGRVIAEMLNERVQYWSIGMCIGLVIIGVGQVMLLKSFFGERKSFPRAGGI